MAGGGLLPSDIVWPTLTGTTAETQPPTPSQAQNTLDIPQRVSPLPQGQQTLDIPQRTGTLPPHPFLPPSQFNYPVTPDLMMAMGHQESGNKPWARGRAGEIGQWQMLPATAQSLGYSPEQMAQDPFLQYDATQRYMGDLLKRYHGNTFLALVAYNSGPGNVDRGRLLPQSVRYATNILKRRDALIAARGPAPGTTGGMGNMMMPAAQPSEDITAGFPRVAASMMQTAAPDAGPGGAPMMLPGMPPPPPMPQQQATDQGPQQQPQAMPQPSAQPSPQAAAPAEAPPQPQQLPPPPQPRPPAPIINMLAQDIPPVTMQRYAQAAGVPSNVSPAQLPPHIQTAIVSQMPIVEIGPQAQTMLRNLAGPQIDPRMTVGQVAAQMTQRQGGQGPQGLQQAPGALARMGQDIGQFFTGTPAYGFDFSGFPRDAAPGGAAAAPGSPAYIGGTSMGGAAAPGGPEPSSPPGPTGPVTGIPQYPQADVPTRSSRMHMGPSGMTFDITTKTTPPTAQQRQQMAAAFLGLQEVDAALKDWDTNIGPAIQRGEIPDQSISAFLLPFKASHSNVSENILHQGRGDPRVNEFYDRMGRIQANVAQGFGGRLGVGILNYLGNHLPKTTGNPITDDSLGRLHEKLVDLHNGLPIVINTYARLHTNARQQGQDLQDDPTLGDAIANEVRPRWDSLTKGPPAGTLNRSDWQGPLKSGKWYSPGPPPLFVTMNPDGTWH